MRLRNLDRLPGEDRGFAGETPRPVERRPGGDDDEAQVRDEHAAPRPVVLVGERPLDAAEGPFAHLPAARAQKRGHAVADGLRSAGHLNARVQRNLVDLHRV